MTSICYEIDMIDLIQYSANQVGKTISFQKPVGTENTVKGGPCPLCDVGRDSFAVFPEDAPQRFYHGIHGGTGCEAGGDAIAFLELLYNIDFSDAREKLIDFLMDNYQKSYEEVCEMIRPRAEIDGQLVDVETGEVSQRQYIRKERRKMDDLPPSDVWQKKAVRFCFDAKLMLLSDLGGGAREWLYSRGLTDATISAAGLGLNLEGGYQSASEWGTDKDVYLARGIVIPWQIEGNLWRVNIRRSNKDIAALKARYEKEGEDRKPAKYVDIHGGSDGLYGADTIPPGLPLVMCEGEIDRLSFLQATHGRIAIVATGGTGRGQGHKWVEAVRQASPILVTFDHDENGAGDQAFGWWQKRLSVVRYTPWAHDINDMLTQGMDLQEWVDMGLDLVYDAGITAVPPVQQARPKPLPIEEEALDELTPDFCSVCGVDITSIERGFYSPDGVPFCDYHDETKEAYCSRHRDEHSPLTLEQFLGGVKLAAERMGGATVTPLEPGYTLADRVAHLYGTGGSYEKRLYPQVECRFCQTKAWVWRSEEGWICCDCYSPLEGEVTLGTAHAQERTPEHYWDELREKLDSVKPGVIPYSELVARDTERLFALSAGTCSGYTVPELPRGKDGKIGTSVDPEPPKRSPDAPVFDETKYDYAVLRAKVNQDIACITLPDGTGRRALESIQRSRSTLTPTGTGVSRIPIDEQQVLAQVTNALNDLGELKNQWKTASRRKTVFWRLKYHGWTPAMISSSEAIKRLERLITEDEHRYEAEGAIDAWMRE